MFLICGVSNSVSYNLSEPPRWFFRIAQNQKKRVHMPEKRLFWNQGLKSTLKKYYFKKFMKTDFSQYSNLFRILFRKFFGNNWRQEFCDFVSNWWFFDAFKGNIFDLRSYQELVFVFFRTRCARRSGALSRRRSERDLKITHLKQWLKNLSFSILSKLELVEWVSMRSSYSDRLSAGNSVITLAGMVKSILTLFACKLSPAKFLSDANQSRA